MARAHVIFLALILSDAFSLDAQEVYFADDFTDNGEAWDLSNENYRISGGKFIMDNPDDDLHAIWNDSHIPGDDFFNIILSCTHESGVDDYGYGLFFGGSDFDHCVIFMIASGSYRISMYDGGDEIELVGWTDDDAIKKGNYTDNVLQVSSYIMNWYFYVNDHLLIKIPEHRLLGSKIGMFVSHRQRISFDIIAAQQQLGPPVQVLSYCEAVNTVMDLVPKGFESLEGTGIKEGTFKATVQVDGVYLPKVVVKEDGSDWMVPMAYIMDSTGTAQLHYLDSLAAILRPCLSDQLLVREAGWLGDFKYEYRSYQRTDDGYVGPSVKLYAFEQPGDTSLIWTDVVSEKEPHRWLPLSGQADRSSALGRSIDQVFAQFPKGFEAWEGEKVPGSGFSFTYQSTFSIAESKQCRVHNEMLSAHDELECVMAEAPDLGTVIGPFNTLVAEVSRILGEGYHVGTWEINGSKKAEFRRFGESGLTEPVVDVSISTADGIYQLKLNFGAEGMWY